jgi:phosphoribosylformimino-5-aminoimidazole carboxamide ribotide isomerase
MRCTVIPAIDVLGTEAVRLRRGDYGDVTNRRDDPVALARAHAQAGARWIHLVDLDGARSGELRPGLVEAVAKAVSPSMVQASGGIRSVADARRLLDAGAARVVVGTAAWASTDAMQLLVDELGELLVVALDVRDGQIASAGWRRSTGLSVRDAVARCTALGVARILCTAIDRDGTLEGPDLVLLSQVVAAGIPVLAAGGVRSETDLDALGAVGVEAAVVGRAFLEGGLAARPSERATTLAG